MAETPQELLEEAAIFWKRDYDAVGLGLLVGMCLGALLAVLGLVSVGQVTIAWQ